MRIAFLITILLTLALVSCKKKCDPSTAEGAAQCQCKISKDFLDALKDLSDTKRIEKVSEEFEYLEEEKKKYIMNGTYTERDVENEMEKHQGECTFLANENMPK